MARIKDYEKMSQERSIIALLKSKRSLAELFNNFDNDRIRGIKKILNELRDRYTKEYRKEIKKSFTKQKIRKIVQNQGKKRLMNILLNQKELSVEKKNIIIMIVMILFTMEYQTQKIYLVRLMKKTITNQYKLKELLKVITKTMKAEETKAKAKNYQ